MSDPRGRIPQPSGSSVAPARRCAYAVLRRVFEQGAWTDRALRGEAGRLQLDARDLALATQLSYGAVQRRATLDHLIEALARRAVERLDPPVLAALRLGVFQLAFLDRVPAHAAVGESVELTKEDAPKGAGLVNAVLRRAAGEARQRVEAMGETTPAEAALRHSHPDWVAELWWETLGPDTARALLAAGNAPAESALRANTLKIGREALLARLGIAAAPAPGLPEGVLLEAPFDAHGSALWDQGLFMPQSRAAMTVARLLAPQPGERVLDLCAAPGGKTTHLAALMEDCGEIVAVERLRPTGVALERTARRMGAGCVLVSVGDAAAPQEPAGFDRVLVDPPCSDLGTLASRPDARWRKTPEQVTRLAHGQAEILRVGAAALAPGGMLVYSTCTISPRENEEVVEAFLAEHPSFEADDLRAEVPIWEHPSVPRHLLSLPHRDGTEGFFIARLRRRTGT